MARILGLAVWSVWFAARMIPGITISMGGNDWIVPPLTLGQMRRLSEQVKRVREIASPMGIDNEEVEAVTQIVVAALSRNYPDMTEDRAADLLDMGNLVETMTAILTGSGLVRPGEAMPAAATSTSASPA